MPRLPGRLALPDRSYSLRFRSCSFGEDRVSLHGRATSSTTPRADPMYCTDTDASAKPAFSKNGLMKLPRTRVTSAARGFRARVEMLDPDSAAARCPQQHAPG